MMARISAVLRSLEGNRLIFWCPGCNEAHWIAFGEGPGPRWGYNGNPDAPTFTPSILVRRFDRLTDSERDRVMAGEEVDRRPVVCHSFVTDGHIQFLGDCTHSLAGQTVPLVEFDKDFPD